MCRKFTINARVLSVLSNTREPPGRSVKALPNSESLGFLSVRQHAEHGFFGGLLILNKLARPIEFHCTLPVQPSRAQVLLYGVTLHDFLCGEQIANALIHKVKQKPGLIITDCRPVLALNLVSSIDTILLADATADECVGFSTPDSTLATRTEEIENSKFEFALEHDVDVEKVAAAIQGLAAHFELAEPFQRIVEALREAHPIVRAA